MRPRSKRNLQRGFSLLETLISATVMTLGLVGITQMQLIAVRTNQFARGMNVAVSQLNDLSSNVSRWAYDDPRLAAVTTITSLDDGRIKLASALGRGKQLPNAGQALAQFSDGDAASGAEDPLVPTANQNILTKAGALPYDGHRVDAGYARFWTVFALQSTGDTSAEVGKLVVMVVRWKEPGLGFREVVQTTFRANPQVRNFL